MLTTPSRRQPGEGDGAVLREAARWIALTTDRPLSDREEDDLAIWLLGDPRRSAALELAMKAWSHAPNLLGNLGYSAASAPRAGPRARIMWVGGALAAACGLILFFWFVAAQPEVFDAPDHPRSVRLADGSTIRLSTGSSIVTDFTDKTRSVRLLRGHAEFDVTKADRPFIVAAGGIDVVVLGTTFTVDLKRDGTDIRLKRGRIALMKGDARVAELYPGDRAAYTAPSAALKLVRSSQAVPASDAGRLGEPSSIAITPTAPNAKATGTMLAFTNVRLDRIAAILEIRTNHRIRLADGAIGTLLVSGNISIEDAEAGLARTVQPLGLKLLRQDEGVMIGRDVAAQDRSGR